MFTNKISRLHINAAKQTLADFLTTPVAVYRCDGNDAITSVTDIPTWCLHCAFDDTTQRIFPRFFAQNAQTDAQKVALAACLRSMTVDMQDGSVNFVPITGDIINGAVGDLKRGRVLVHVFDPGNPDFKDFDFDI